MGNNKDIISGVEKYYSEKVKAFGANAKGVDWNSEESQNIRFVQLLKLINTEGNFSVLDYGCGYGTMFGFMKSLFPQFKYTGFDISVDMLKEAQALYVTDNNAEWMQELGSDIYDYSIASGIFNVKQQHGAEEWKVYIEETLQEINKVSGKGFAFNMLTSYSDTPFMKDYLYYADPCYFFDYCKRNFSKNVALLHDYELYEFCILVKK